MIKYSLQTACQLIHCKKHQLKYWQSHLDPESERHRFSFRALLGFRFIQFLIEDCHYSVGSLKKGDFIPLFQAIESCPDELTLCNLWLIFNFRQKRFELVSSDRIVLSTTDALRANQFTLIKVESLFLDLWSAFKTA